MDNVNRQRSKYIKPCCYRDSVEKEVNVKRRPNFLAPLFHPPIDSSVIRDMDSSYGFSSSEVIQSVQKNRPGPALATYHLLRKKKSWRKSRLTSGKQSERRSSAKVKQKQEEKSLNQNVLNASDGAVSIKSHPQPLQLPNKKPSDSLSSAEKRPFKITLSNSSKNEKENKSIVTEKVDFNAKTTKQQPQTPTKLTIIPNYFNSAKPASQHIDKKSVETKSEEDQHQPPQANKNVLSIDHNSNTKPTNTVTINFKSHSSEVKEMLTNMQKARQVLAKRQQLNQQQKRVNLSNSKVDQPVPVIPTKKQTEKENQATVDEGKGVPQTSVKASQSAQKIYHQLISEQRSSSQQASRSKVEHNSYNNKQSPFKRPVSHDSLLPEMSDKTIALDRIIAGSPQRWKRSTELSHSPEKNKQEAKNLPGPTRTNLVTLPRIFPKPVPRRERNSQEHKISPPSNVKTTRRSLPASYAHYSGNHRPSFQSTANSKAEAVNNYNHKKGDTKPAIAPKWQTSPTKNVNHDVKPQFNYYISNPAGTSPSHRQRPKKVISEPIAAAISYLTATKHKAFRKEKPPSITTG